MAATNPLDNTCPDARDVSLDYLVPWCAEHKRAARVDGRKQRIAVFEAVFEVGEGFAEFLDEPVEFAFLFWWCKRFNQHPRCLDTFHHFGGHVLMSEKGYGMKAYLRRLDGL